jgi:hypothetical protein
MTRWDEWVLSDDETFEVDDVIRDLRDEVDE